MRTPPHVVVVLGPDAAWRGLWVLLPALSGACLGLWLAMLMKGHYAGSDDGLSGGWWHPSLVLLTLGGAVTGAWVGWRCSHTGSALLAWTGSTWRLTPLPGPGPAEGPVQPSDGHPCEPALMVDLGNWLLLRVRWSGSKPREAWWAVSARMLGPAAWHGLCVALHGARVTSELVDPL